MPGTGQAQDLGTLYNNGFTRHNAVMSPKCCLPVGCTDAREIRQRLRLGLPGHTAPPCRGTPRLSSPPRHHPGMLAGLSLFIISDSSGCQRPASCRASKHRAGKRLSKSTEEGLRGWGRKTRGSGAAAPSVDMATARVWPARSDPAPAAVLLSCLEAG